MDIISIKYSFIQTYTHWSTVFFQDWRQLITNFLIAM